ncbi:Hypothetical predicted protein, partial [Lynx pardinus]
MGSPREPSILENCGLIVSWNDLEGLAHQQELPVIDESVSLGKTTGLEVNGDDIQELVEEHGQELTPNKPMDLCHEQQQEVIKKITSAEEE